MQRNGYLSGATLRYKKNISSILSYRHLGNQAIRYNNQIIQSTHQVSCTTKREGVEKWKNNKSAEHDIDLMLISKSEGRLS